MTEVTEELYPKPLYKHGTYQLPWKFGLNQSRPSVATFLWESYKEESRSDIPPEKSLDEIDAMKITPLSQTLINSPPQHNAVQITWLGHASALVQFDGINILFDPVFSKQIGPIPHLGMKRFRNCPCSVHELPNIDIVLISHDHYDHLDVHTVKLLDERFGSKLHWCVPMGLKTWFLNTIKSDQISELNWWKDMSVVGAKVTCVPAQHWSKRSLFDENTRLWSGWVVEGHTQKVYHAGDTGYCNIFKSIGGKFGPIDVALIPIGAYCPRNVLSFQHVDPKEAVQIHKDVQATKSIGIHWGTFALTREFYLEPPQALKEALDEAAISDEHFVTLRHGQTITIQSTR